MNKELIINAVPNGVEIALLEDKKLVELHRESAENPFGVGDIYLGKVKKLMPGLNAAFVDVGYEKDAFLHYTDLSPYIRTLMKFTNQHIGWKGEGVPDFGRLDLEPEIIKSGKITEVFQGKGSVLVQILKEPIAAKGPRLSCEISLPGRFVVLTPFNDVVAVSKKIHSSDERRRLQKIMEAIKPKNFGVIVRTAAEGKNTAELHDDLNHLTAKWGQIQANLRGAEPPVKILSEQDKATSILRDLLSADFHRIVVNDAAIYQDIRQYLERIAPDKLDIVQQYSHQQSIFDTYGITKQVKGAFGKTVSLPSGAYLIVEPTEALHVIDVNSGYKSAASNQEENSLSTNLEAAQEIARQLRLRDLGGIIVVDFIDMKLPDNKKKLFDAMQEFMRSDRARHTILPISKFGLMQITRQRMKQEIEIKSDETCPTCNGTGKIASTLVLEDGIAKNLGYLITHGHKRLTILVHPIMAAYLKSGFPSIRMKWMLKHKQWIGLKAMNTLPLVAYKFLDANEEEIRL